jgi:uncharacterized OsmC-like protein
MESGALRDLQRPLKQAYKDDPGQARIPASATARLDVDGLTCTVSSWRSETVAGLHPAAGGTGEFACSADMLLEALVACAGVTLTSVATAMALEIRSATVRADGHWDARGTLGVDRDAPVGLTDVTLHFDLETDAADDVVARLVSLTERYCVIAATLANPPEVAFSHSVTRPG